MTSPLIFSSRLALGTVQFGIDYGISNDAGKTSQQEVGKILSVAHNAGIMLLDTAGSYGDSESVLGQFVNNDFDLVSKIYIDNETSRLSAQAMVAKSLNELKQESLYGLLVHNPDAILENKEAWDHVKELRLNGMCKKIGYSVYRTDQLKWLLDSGIIPDIVQLPYNFFDRRFSEVFGMLKKAGIEIHSRSVFLQGLFFIKPENLPRHFDPIKDLLKKIQQTHPDSKHLAAWLLNFVLQENNIDKIIFGVNNSTQLQDNLSLLQSITLQEAEDVGQIPESILLPFLWPKQ